MRRVGLAAACAAAVALGCGREPGDGAPAVEVEPGASLLGVGAEPAGSGGDRVEPAGLIELAVLPGFGGDGAAEGGEHRGAHARGPLSDRALPEGARFLGFGALELPGWRPPGLLDGLEDGLEDGGEDGGERPRLESLLGAEVRAATGERVALDGYAVALDWTEDRVSLAWLQPAPESCCFGAPLGLDAQVEVEFEARAGPALARSAEQPLRVVGRLEVGERGDGFGFVTSIYRLREARFEEL